MPKIRFVFLIINLLLLSGYADARIYPDSIKKKVLVYLKNYNFNVSLNDITIEDALPDFKLYELHIQSYSIENNIIYVRVKISDFFNKSNYKIILCNVKKTQELSVLKKKIKFSPREIVKIIYEFNNIRIISKGKIISCNGEYYTVKNNFGKKFKCIPVENNILKAVAEIK